MSIVRFYADTPSLPIWIPTITYESSDANKTIYSCTLSWTDPSSNVTYDYQQYIQFSPQLQAIAVPGKAANSPQQSTEYYYVYSYQYFVSQCNNMFQSAYDGLNALVTAAGKTLPSTYAPVMTIDTANNLCTLNADVNGYNDTAKNYIQIWFNP